MRLEYMENNERALFINLVKYALEINIDNVDIYGSNLNIYYQDNDIDMINSFLHSLIFEYNFKLLYIYNNEFEIILTYGKMDKIKINFIPSYETEYNETNSDFNELLSKLSYYLQEKIGF
jgi:hypothetical protein